MRCSVKTCQSKSGPGSEVHFFRFPLNNKKCLDKWITIVGKPNWKPLKTSRICSLHFNEIDIVQNMGYQRAHLRENTVPKNCFLSDVKEEETDILKTKEISNIKDIDKVVSPNKTSILNRNIIYEHNYSNNIFVRIENAGSNIFNTREACPKEKRIVNQEKKYEFIHITSDIFPHASTNSIPREENDVARIGKIVNKLSKNMEILKRQNKTLKQKLRRHKRKIASMKQMFDRL